MLKPECTGRLAAKALGAPHARTSSDKRTKDDSKDVCSVAEENDED